MTDSPTVRARLPYASLAGIVLVVLMTLGNAAANMIPTHLPTTRELQRAEQDEIVQARRDRIAELQAAGDHCDAQIARELSRSLFFDGRSAAPYADDYASRCGDDPVVRRWADASAKLHLRR
ncbi:MAG TPA: hypothetical protein VMZ53_09835 [Kofleriaceae bacterium]|nr:hypothetical protein [Kofleriaceae bacterium]